MSQPNTPKKKKSIIKRIFKWTGITFLVLLVAIIVLPIIFKDKIIQIVKDEANKNLNAKVDFGAFDLSIFSTFPNFKFEIENVSVVGINEFEGDTLAYLKKLETEIDLMSVINGDKYEVIRIALITPKINGIVNGEGKANWDITKPSVDTTAAEPADTSKTKFKLGLKEFSISDANITYNDMPGSMKAALQDWDFKLSGDFTQDNFLMEIFSEIQKLSFSMGGVSYASDMHNTLKISLDADMPNMKFTFKENEFIFNELSLGLDGFVAMPGNDINMDVKFLAKQTEFKNILSLVPAVFKKDFASVKTAGKLALNGFAKGTYNDKTMPAFGLHLEIAQAMFKYPSLPKSVDNINVLLDVNNPNGNPDATVIDLKKLHIEMAGNPVDARMHVETPVSDPNLNGMVKGKIVLASVKDFVPMEKDDAMSGTITMDINLGGRMSSITNKKYEEFKAEGTLLIDQMNYHTATLPYDVMINAMKLTFNPKAVELNTFDAKMGNTDIQAGGKIENFLQYVFQDSLIKGTFSLNSKVMDINQLMGPSGAEQPAATPAAQDTTPMSVVEVPKNIDFEMNTNIGKLIYDNIDITDVAGRVVIRNAKVDMTNLKMNLMEGSMVMSGYYETKNIQKPTINFNLNISNFDIQKTVNTFESVQKMAPVAKNTKGKFSTSISDLTGTLNSKMEPDLNSLNCKGNLKTQSVSVEDFEPFVKLDDALKLNKLKKIDLNNTDISYEVKNGRAFIKPMKTKIADIPVEISGSTGFDQTIDYKWDLEVPTKLMGSQANSALQGLLSQANNLTGANAALPEKVKVSALIGGTVTKPEVKTGLKDAMKNAQQSLVDQGKQIIEEKKQEVIQEVKKNVEEQVNKLLAEAQKQADAIKAEGAKQAENVKAEAYKQAEELEKKGANPLEKIANKKLAEQTRKQGDASAKKITDEANAKADKIMSDANAQADKLRQQ